jgi:hypothetical protein
MAAFSRCVIQFFLMVFSVIFIFLQFHTDRDNLCKLLMLLKISKMEDILYDR